MPLVAESAWHGWAWNPNDDLFSATWDLDFPPTAAFIKVAQGHYFEWGGDSAVDTGLINMRRRKPDGSDETVTFPDIGVFSPVYVQFDPAMTHVTFGIKVRNCSASLVWWLGTWA